MRRAIHLLGFPLERYFENMVRFNMIVNCPVTHDNVKNTRLIFGPAITSLKGISVRCKPSSIVTDYIEIPREILESRKDLKLSTDIIFVNKLLKFTMIEYLSSKNDIALVTSINKIVSYYKSHVLHVGTMFVDTEFQFLEGKVVSATRNTTRARDHVP